MSTTVRVQYPGDPAMNVVLMTGSEFERVVRNGQPGEIVVSSFKSPSTRIIFDEVICDCCNCEIADDVECALGESRLYCKPCFKEWLAPHIIAEVRP